MKIKDPTILIKIINLLKQKFYFLFIFGCICTIDNNASNPPNLTLTGTPITVLSVKIAVLDEIKILEITEKYPFRFKKQEKEKRS